MRRNERHADCQDGGRESTAARQDKRGLAVIPLAGGRLSSEFQQRPMHIEKRHELQYHGQVQQVNKGFLHAFTDKTNGQEDRGKAGMHDQRDIRCSKTLVQLAQTLRQVQIETGNERNPRRARKPSRGDSGNGNAEYQGEGGDDPGHLDLLGHMTDRLNDALEDADILFAHGQKQGQSCADIQNTRQQTSPANGSRKRTPRILNLVTHDGSQFQSHQAEADDPERSDQTKVASNTKVGGGHGGAKTKEHDKAEADKHDGGNGGTDPTQIIDPLTDAQTAHIEGRQEDQQHDRCAERKQVVVSQGTGARTRDIN